MNPQDIIPQLRSGSSVLECKLLCDGSMHRVPVVHAKLEYLGSDERREFAAEAFDGLPALRSFEQLRALVGDGTPIGLYVPQRVYEASLGADDPGALHQFAYGSVHVLSPSDWAMWREGWSDWFFDGAEAEFADLPFGFEDTQVFAARNFSPDLWYIVTRGEMAGKVYMYGHDGEAGAWAEDLTGWAERIHSDLEGAFGGVIRFRTETDPTLSEGAELFPLRVVE
jgi:hypothetical protein